MLTRRQFVAATGSAAAATIAAPQALAAGLTSQRRAPLARGGRFAEGVMSGEPTPRAITLWTRVADLSGSVSVELEVARDRDFRNVVARKRVGTSAALDHAAKARVTGLRPYEQYYYRFSTRTQDGPVGRFRTALPADSQQPVRFAFWSCDDFTHGYFNAFERMARDDLDFVVCLGDYIYAETYHARSDGTAVRDDRVGRDSARPRVVREAFTLADYRDKYRLYRSDPSLRKLQARFPTVVVWDDHELTDNYAGAAPGGGLPPERRVTAQRKAAAYRAFFEAMPYHPPAGTRRIYRRLQFGRTVDLILMDQRQYRADQPCNDANSVPACADYDQPRDFLGRRQLDWVKAQLGASKAAWKVLANQVLAMPARALGESIVYFDSWDGYPREREELLAFINDTGIKDVVFATGDVHNFIAGDVRTQAGLGQPAAVEFVAGSVTSTSFGEIDLPAGQGVVIKGNDANPRTDPGILQGLLNLNPWVLNADFDHHGYARAVATQASFTCEMVRLQTIKRRSVATLPADGFRYRLARGQTLKPA